MAHPVPDLSPDAVISALLLLGYTEPDLDTELPTMDPQRVHALLMVLLAVTEAHVTARGGALDEVYFAVSDHLAENTCACSFGATSAA